MRPRRQLSAHRPADCDIDEAALGVFVCSAGGGRRGNEIRASVTPGESFTNDLGCEGKVGGAGGAFEVVGAGAVEFICLCWVCASLGIVGAREVIEGGRRDGGGRRGAWGGGERCEAGG